MKRRRQVGASFRAAATIVAHAIVVLVVTSAEVVADESLTELRDHYQATIDGILSLETRFRLEVSSSPPKVTSIEEGRWIMDGERRHLDSILMIEQEGHPPYPTRNWLSFDGQTGLFIGFSGEDSSFPRELVKRVEAPPQLIHTYTVECWLGTRLKDSFTSLSEMLHSDGCRIERTSNDGPEGSTLWHLDLGVHPSPGPVPRHWWAVLADHYGTLPVEFRSDDHVEEGTELPEGTRLMGETRWTIASWMRLDDPLLESGRWLPETMRCEIPKIAGTWSLSLSETTVNRVGGEAFEEPPLKPGTNIIDETVPNRRKVTVHRADEVIADANLQAESPDKATAPRIPAVALPPRTDFYASFLRWGGILVLGIVALGHLIRTVRR